MTHADCDLRENEFWHRLAELDAAIIRAKLRLRDVWHDNLWPWSEARRLRRALARDERARVDLLKECDALMGLRYGLVYGV